MAISHEVEANPLETRESGNHGHDARKP